MADSQSTKDRDMRDWPRSLCISAGQEALAQAMYGARCLAFSVPEWSWDKITELEKATLRAEALVWLLAHAPVPKLRVDYFKVAVDGATDYRARVIGTIAKEPDGQ